MDIKEYELIKNEIEKKDNKILSKDIKELMDNIYDILYDNGFKDDRIAQLVILGAKLGLSRNNVILDKTEKEIIKENFEELVSNSIEEIYDILEEEFNTEDLTLIITLLAIMPEMKEEYLKFVLSFAFINGIIEDEVDERIKNYFQIDE